MDTVDIGYGDKISATRTVPHTPWFKQSNVCNTCAIMCNNEMRKISATENVYGLKRFKKTLKPFKANTFLHYSYYSVHLFESCAC